MILVELGGGLAPHPEATVVIDTHHPKGAPAQDCTQTPWIADDPVMPDRVKPDLIPYGSVDVVYASHLLEHIPHGAPIIRVFNEAWRVLRPGGRFNMRLPLVGYTQPSTGEPVRDHIGWQPWADPTHVSFWWFPEALLYFCEGNFRPNADYGIKVWAPLGNWTDDPFTRPAGGWYPNHGWEGVASLLKPGRLDVNVMVTGGGGFIGRAVIAELVDRGHVATRFDRADGNDILDVPTLDDRVHDEIDTIIHLAGVLGTDELFDDPRLAVRVNVGGALNVLEACRRHGVDYVGISMPDVFPSIYTATKVGAQRLAEAYGRAYGFGVIHVVAFNAFGEGQAHGPGHPQKIVPTFATCAARGEPVPIWGDGLQTVDLIYVAELARVLVEAAEHIQPDGPVDKMNMVEAGTGNPFTVLDVARMIAETLGVNLKVDFLPMRRGERPSKVRACGIGWEVLSSPPTWRADELDKTVRWYADRA